MTASTEINPDKTDAQVLFAINDQAVCANCLFVAGVGLDFDLQESLRRSAEEVIFFAAEAGNLIRTDEGRAQLAAAIEKCEKLIAQSRNALENFQNAN